MRQGLLCLSLRLKEAGRPAKLDRRRTDAAPPDVCANASSRCMCRTDAPPPDVCANGEAAFMCWGLEASRPTLSSPLHTLSSPLQKRPVWSGRVEAGGVWSALPAAAQAVSLEVLEKAGMCSRGLVGVGAEPTPLPLLMPPPGAVRAARVMPGPTIPTLTL